MGVPVGTSSKVKGQATLVGLFDRVHSFISNQVSSGKAFPTGAAHIGLFTTTMQYFMSNKFGPLCEALITCATHKAPLTEVQSFMSNHVAL